MKLASLSGVLIWEMKASTHREDTKRSWGTERIPRGVGSLLDSGARTWWGGFPLSRERGVSGQRHRGITKCFVQRDYSQEGVVDKAPPVPCFIEKCIGSSWECCHSCYKWFWENYFNTAYFELIFLYLTQNFEKVEDIKNTVSFTFRGEESFIAYSLGFI